MVMIAPLRSVRLAASRLPPKASTKPRATARPRPGSGDAAVRRLGAIEFVEDMRQRLRRNARPFVRDRQQ